MNAIFGFLGSIFGYVLWAIYYVIPNFAVAIIIFTLIVKIALFPSSVKQQKSMAANSRLQKKQQEIKEKYGNDKQKYNEEMQKLYDKEGASPFSGCSTMFLPLLVMLGIYYSVVRPLTNMLHIAQDSVTKVLEIANKFPGVSINSASIYSEIDLIRLFNNENTFNFLTKSTNVSHILTGDEISKIRDLSGGFNFLGLDLLTTPKTAGIFSWAMLIPVLCLLTSIGSQLYMMRKQNSAMNSQQGCMKYMMLALPLFTAWIAYTVPCAVGFYWVCSTVFGFIQSVILQHFYSPAQITAKTEAAHVALLELNEAKVEYDYNPVSAPAQPASKNQKKKKK